jgi:hypothetical protein
MTNRWLYSRTQEENEVVNRQIVHGRIPGPEKGEDSVEPRERPPIGMAGPGSGATNELRILSVEFASDHGVLLDHDTDWEDGGLPFDKPEWPKKAGDPAGHPVSHTWDQPIELDVKVEFTGPRSKGSISGTLMGVDAKDGTKVFERRWRFRRGKQTIRVKSTKPFPKEVKTQDVDWLWLIQGKGINPLSFLGLEGVQSWPAQTQFEIFMTQAEPSTVLAFPGITYRRMKHAVAKVSEAASIDPHVIVKHLMSTFPVFNLGANPRNAWLLGEPGAAGDCRTIVRYVINILLMVGIPGDAKCVLVYEKLRADFPGHPFRGDRTMMQLEREPTAGDFSLVAEEPTEDQKLGGLDKPGLIHPNGRWSLILFDRGGGQNVFEACLEFTYAGDTVFHAGGVSDFKTKEEVIRGAFKSLSWGEFDRGDPATTDDDKMVPVTGKDIKVY